MTDAQRREQYSQHMQTKEHLRKLFTALIAYCDALNIRMTIEVRNDQGKENADVHVGRIDMAHPDRVLTDTDMNTAANALQMLAIRTTLGHWPEFMKAQALQGVKAHNIGTGGAMKDLGEL
jgi:hypothetical protein